jgi:hypothetical protein
MTESELIDLSPDIRGFFHRAVDEAVKSTECGASHATVFYIAALLADYAHPRVLQRGIFDQPVTFLLHRALSTHGPERFERLQALGDDVLYVSGFFGDHLASRGVELGFVANLGSRAYDEAAAILRSAQPDAAGPDVFGELSTHFSELVHVVHEVADVLHARAARSASGMLEVYERWLKTGSVALAGALTDWGVMPKRSDGTIQ